MIAPKHVSPKTSFTTNGKLVYVYEFDEGEGLLIHEHPYPHELYIVAGQVCVCIEPLLKEMQSGDVVRCPHGAHHGVIARSRASMLSIFNEEDVTNEGVL